MHGRSGTRNIKQVSVGYEEIPNRERCRLALLLFYVESRRKRKDVLNTDIKTRRQWNILGADFAECVCVCVCVCVKVKFISILLTFMTVATAATSITVC